MACPCDYWIKQIVIFYLPVTERQYTASASSRCNEVAGLLCRDDYAVNESVIYIHCTVRRVCVCVCAWTKLRYTCRQTDRDCMNRARFRRNFYRATHMLYFTR